MTIGFPQPRVRALRSSSLAAPIALSIVAAIIALSIASCSGGGGTGNQTRPDGGGTKKDMGVVQPVPDSGETADGPTTPKAQIGQACQAGTDCASSFCADGVCCKTACTGTCVTCSAAGSVGTCIPADVGTDPHNDCADQGKASCGTDGVCDGTGACEKYVAGVACQSAGCTGSMLAFAGRCDGLGTCDAPASQQCAPYVCGTGGQCKTTCSSDADCTTGTFCVSGSCGLKPPGASCGADGDCKSTHCAQGVCCGTTCTGNCQSCAIAGSAGTCINVPAGQDPLSQCADQTAASCKTNGFCDGLGACQLYPASTVCGTNSCASGVEAVAGKCDGAGTCQTGTTQACNAYVCDSTGVCKTTCTASTDCATGYFCIGGSCTKKAGGATCSADSDCGTGHCAQGVCCNTACTGTCMSCALTATNGTCTAIAAGADPLNQCTDVGSTNPCGTNGSCNGAGACQFYPAGTTCGAAASCTGSTLTQGRTCDGAGTCRAATTVMCDPFECGTGACKTTCSTSTDCVSPNSCVSNSCGKLPPGAVCTAGTVCASGFCAQGVCCNSACAGICTSCALTGSMGTCSPVATGQAPTPATQCTMTAASTCGTDGTCNGAGACRSYVSGTQCVAPSCSGSTLTSAQTCDGAGICRPATTGGCAGNLNCGSATACKTTCTADGDCVSPYVCKSGSCALKTPGTTCTTAGECASGFCQQGVCCMSACTGACQSCALATSLGTCANIGAGAAPILATQCTDTGATGCGTNGLCDGTGKCQLYATGTQCAGATCVGDTLTPLRTCDGAGTCKTVTSTLCDPYACGTNNACKTTCAVGTDCTSPASCTIATGQTTGTCGKLAIGQPCTAAAMCNSGFCAQTVCCNNACAGTCSSCNLSGTVGTCTSIAGGQPPVPATQCTDQGASTCGTNGLCNGSGACQKYPSGTQCAGGSCTGSSATAVSTCNASNTCVAPAPTNCTPYICGANACKTTCATTADCLAPDVCLGTTCSPPINVTVKTKTSASSTFIYFEVQLTNTGTMPITLSQITMKYWYTWDVTTGAPTESASCTYSLGVTGGSCTNVTEAFSVVTPALADADHIFTLGFSSGAMTLAAGATAEIGPGINKSDFSTFTQTNDYSYNSSTTFTTNAKVTVYLNGSLVYGTEPTN